MINETETQEKQHLEQVQRRLETALEKLGRRVSRYARDVRDQKKHIWEHKGDMDHIEKIAARESADQSMRSGAVAFDAKRRLQKLVQTPYFGRLDFRKNGHEAQPIYVGIHAFADEERDNIIFDWRAPISAMFYDYELGPAQYQSPSGQVCGEVTLKRQYRIRHGRMEFMLESGLNIVDDVLQEELSRSSDDRMKNIVATIQRDQNAIVRNEDAEVLIIQGVAGSGKTSIALHRIAFLLYRFKDTLSSKDILIISPNKVFADFISNVLPELGEEQIAELEMESLADEVLGRRYEFETHLEQSSRLLQRRDPELERRIRKKASPEFLEMLDRYVKHVEAARFRPVDLLVRNQTLPAEALERAYRRRPDMPLPKRLRWVAECAEQEAWSRWHYELTVKERSALRAAVKRMGRNATLRTLYREFYDWLGDPKLFKRRRGSALEYSDVFPMIYLGLRLERSQSPYEHVKHLVVDEMQDYTPVQYAVLAMLFRCNKTILGDVNQSLSWAASSAEAISEIFRHAECVTLRKSYRSSYEITRFAQGIAPSADLVAIERHGTKPKVLSCRNTKEEIAHVVEQVASFSARDLATLGILCKTPKQAERVWDAIVAEGHEAHLLSAKSTAFVRGVVVCSVHLAKGLEFDQVVVPHATEDNYATALDRNLLYVACTRAMHDLTLTHTGPRTSFIAEASTYVVGV